MTHFVETEMHIQLNFTDTFLISADGLDTLRIKVINPIFLWTPDYEQLEKNTEMEGSIPL